MVRRLRGLAAAMSDIDFDAGRMQSGAGGGYHRDLICLAIARLLGAGHAAPLI